MYNLSIRSEWEESAEQFCHKLSSDDESEDESVYDVRKALERLVHVSETDTVYDISKSYSEPDSETESV